MSQICKIAFTAVLISLISLCSISCATNDDGGSGSGSGNGHSGTYTFWKDGNFLERITEFIDEGIKAKIFVLYKGDPDLEGDDAYAHMYLITEISDPSVGEAYRVNVGDLYYFGMVDWWETNSDMEEDTGESLWTTLGPAPARGESKTYQYDETPIWGSGAAKGNVTVTNNISKNNTLEVKFFK